MEMGFDVGRRCNGGDDMRYYTTDTKGSIKLIRIHKGVTECRAYRDGILRSVEEEPWIPAEWFLPKRYKEYYKIKEEDIMLEML